MNHSYIDHGKNSKTPNWSPTLGKWYQCCGSPIYICNGVTAFFPIKGPFIIALHCSADISITFHRNAGFRLACRLPLCRYAAWSSLAVSELQLSAATPLWLYHRAASLQSWIEFNCLRYAAVGKAARLSIYWLDAACHLVIPLRQVALAQLNKYHHQSGNAASGKLVWNQHNSMQSIAFWVQMNLQHCSAVMPLSVCSECCAPTQC